MAAPVVLFTYNRIDEALATMEALSLNYLAKETDVFVYSNAPINEEDAETIHVLRERLLDYRYKFKHFNIICRDKNNGSNDNMIFGISDVLSHYSEVIVLEDDIITSKNFLDFMNQALKEYEKDDDVFSICGYNPVKEKTLLIGDSFSYDAFRSWGWAIWKDRWQLFDFDEYTLDHINLRKARTEGLMYITAIRYDIIQRKFNEATRYLDYKLACKQMAMGKTVIYSKKSLCDNIGMNGTGLTCSQSESVNQNFTMDDSQRTFDLSRDKLNIYTDPKYFFEFRYKEYAMDVYFDITFNREFLNKTMYMALALIGARGGSIASYLENEGIFKVAIYGWGEVGKLLYEILEKSKISVEYILDRCEKEDVPCKMYTSFGNLPQVDMIIVTVIRDFASIEETLHGINSYPLVCVDDIVLECKLLSDVG